MSIRIEGILLDTGRTILVGIAQAIVVAPHRRPEVWGEAHPDTRGHAVTDHLHLVAEDTPGLEETIERRVEARRGGEVKDTIEAIDPLRLSAVGRSIILSAGLIGVPALIIVSAQGQIHVAKELVRR